MGAVSKGSAEKTLKEVRLPVLELQNLCRGTYSPRVARSAVRIENLPFPAHSCPCISAVDMVFVQPLS